MLARNPGYRVVVFDDADIEAYVSKHYGGTDVERAFHRLKVGAARADLWRYLVLYREGGVYLDLDSEIVVSLDETLIRDGDTAVITRESNRNFMAQYMLIFGPRHPILARVIALSTNAILHGPRLPEGDALPEDKWLQDPLLYLAGPPVFNRAVDEEARAVLGRAPPWNVWDAPDSEVNPQLQAATGARLYGHDYEGAVVFKHEYVGQMHWFAPHWRDEGAWGGATVVFGWLGAVAVLAAALVGGTRWGRAAIVAALRSRIAPAIGCCSLFAVFGWLILRGFIQVL